MSNLADHPIGAVFPWQNGEETVMLKSVKSEHCLELCHFYDNAYQCLKTDCEDRIYILHNPKDTE